MGLQYIDPRMHKKIEGWYSPALGLDMPIVTYGHSGRPLLVFPTAAADFLENERFFLIKSIEPFIFEGRQRARRPVRAGQRILHQHQCHSFRRTKRRYTFSPLRSVE